MLDSLLYMNLLKPINLTVHISLYLACLTASTEVPADAKQPLPKDPKDKPRSFTNGAKLEL